MKCCKCVHILFFVLALLVVVGGLNWGLVGFFDFDLVQYLLGGFGSIYPTVVYDVVGVSAVLLLVMGIVKCFGGCCGGGVKCEDGKCECECEKGKKCCK